MILSIVIFDYISGDRLNHTTKVTEQSNKLVNLLRIDRIKHGSIVKAASLHDIGYSDKIHKETGFHPLDGYLYLKDKVHPKIAMSVLMHTDSIELVNYTDKKTIELFHKEMQKGKNYIDKDFIEIVSLSDMLTNSKGEEVTLGERLLDVLIRYGEDDYRYKVMYHNMDKYNNLLQK